MEEETQKIDELTVPDGGIGNFVMEDDEIEEVYGEKPTDYGDEGIAQFPALAERMAKYGRNEDNMLAHVSKGELVIPRQFLQDEVIKQRIYDILTEAGVEDPEAYVVGTDANDINPTTGLPEFFLKKLLGGIAKAVSSVAKTVVKVVKKVAPVVLPIALSFTPLGPIYGAALGSGIGTLIKGGSIKDALKSALVAGATGAAFQGFTGSGSFTENVKAGVADPFGRFGQTVSGAKTSVSNLVGGEAARAANAGQPGFFGKYTPTGVEGQSAAGQQMAADVAAETGTTVQATGADGTVTGSANAPPLTPDQAAATTGAAPGTPITPAQAAA